MSKPRASIFEADDVDIDVSRFTPKTAPDPAAPAPEQVRAISEAANFPSREARKPASKTALADTPRRQPRRHRTGRTAQFNARTTPETVEAFYAIADRKGWLVGETVERALAALQRELEGQGRG
jgi:hypothetical protein